jgi:endonuclease/exonuclease/phosphatase family metal-dependent hydrolase
MPPDPPPGYLRIPAPVRWLLVAPFAAWAVVRLFGLECGTLAAQLVAFTPYVAAVSLFALMLVLLARDPVAIAAAVLACAGLGAAVLPRAFGAPSTADGPQLTVMSINMRLGQADPVAIVDLVRTRGVDVLTVQEYSVDGDTGLLRAGLLTLLPNAERDAVVGSPGSAVYSRLSLADPGYRTNAGGFDQAHATVHVGLTPISVVSVHPRPPVDPAATRDWATDLRAEPPAPAGGLGILAGDFNSTLDHAELRRLIDTGYHDAAAAAGAGLTSTWPYYGPRSSVTPKITLDHILVSAAIGVRSFAAVTVPGTDHRAVIAALVLP